jgi:hypothetical protein
MTVEEWAEVEKKLEEAHAREEELWGHEQALKENVLVNPHLERRLKELLPECKSFDDFFDWITDAKNVMRDAGSLLRRAEAT